MKNYEYQKYLEEVSKKLDRLNQASGGINKNQINHKIQRNSTGDGFNDDILDIMGNSSINWMKNNNKNEPFL